MEKSFVIVPNEPSEPPGVKNISFSMIIKRREMINDICEGTEKSHKTDYPHIVKLCRLCSSDICKELTERINFETKRFKKYTKVHEQLLTGTYPDPVEDPNGLIEDLAVHITDAKYLYNQYHTLFQELKKKTLYTKACVICAETKPTD